MPKLLSPSPLHRIEECPDLMADGCLCDGQNNLVFGSFWGRDTAVQEFLARLTLSASEQGIEQFHLITDNDVRLPVSIGNADRLEKRTTRTYRCTLFGPMVHVWLFDKRCIKPDKANASAFAVLPKGASNRTPRLWALVQAICPLPLLDHWRDSVLELLQCKAMLSSLPFAIGALEGCHLALDIPVLTTELGGLIRSGTLRTTQSEPSSDGLLRYVA